MNIEEQKSFTRMLSKMESPYMEIEKLKKAIDLLSDTLQFYAKEENYKENVQVGYSMVSPIELDKGQKAKYILQKVL